MKIQPSNGTAFIIEDSEDFSSYEKMGLEIPEDAKKGVGSTGIIYAVTHDQEGIFPRLRHWLFAERINQRWKVGQRVIFDKFVANDIYLRDEEGNEIKKLRSIPNDCILGSISKGDSKIKLQ